MRGYVKLFNMSKTHSDVFRVTYVFKLIMHNILQSVYKDGVKAFNSYYKLRSGPEAQMGTDLGSGL